MGENKIKIDAYNDYSECTLCPRNCRVDRGRNKVGVCQVTNEIVIGRAALHMWEEPCISGDKGSGAVFFSGCQLGCVFCQNRKISKGQGETVLTIEDLVNTFFDLKSQGAHNINLVTPDHYVPSIILAIKLAKSRGFDLPFVYNCSGYEKAERLKELEGYIDIYLPDFKYMSTELAAKYSKAPDYPEVAKKAIAEMVKQVGTPSFFENGIMKKGVIVRHLQMPDQMEDSKKIISYLYETYGDNIFISIMNQYTPMPGIEEKYPELGRKITEKEYDELVDYAIDIGVENGFIQEGETASESFIPDFK